MCVKFGIDVLNKTANELKIIFVQNLYDMLMKMLEERGVDADFVDHLIEFCTSYEHSKYVDTLEKLRDFIDAK